MARVSKTHARLLFATTNHIERLDPALSRPGRMDVWINFKNATRWQAEGIFKCFFPAAKAKTAEDETATDEQTQPAVQNLPVPKRKGNQPVVPQLPEDEINKLAKDFANSIPEDEFSVSTRQRSVDPGVADDALQVAALQGYLLKNKTRPRECVAETPAW